MLAVARALLLNGSLVVMDEPSEGLAPTIVDTLIEVVHQLVVEGVAVLVVEQNLRAATHMADRQLVMTSGRIAAESSAAELIANPQLQRRYLGVETADTRTTEVP
jgi:branched-chain amino acid transport system ATP-binding protein